MKKKWWQQQNIYQIYLRSFLDTNNDGIGDIKGITKKLTYLKELGIGIIWISPHYDSPMDDNGYDVRDFYKISPDYGTIEDFKQLLFEAHKLQMHVITDLVLNHTSDEHEWFKAAKNPNDAFHQKYHDYYIWQNPIIDNQGNKQKPTRWIGWFGSSTWEYNLATNEYYLHIFSKKMPDLNWRNPNLRSDMKKMIKWWLDLGIDGFRVDASNHLEKNWDFPDTFPGYENFSSLPKHHEYLKELGTDIFVPYDILTIGESGGATKEEALQYVGYDSNEFNMLIQFGHCWADIDDSHSKLMGKWAQGNLHVSKIKQSFCHWYELLDEKGWNVIYWHNHDQPRIVSHYGNDQEFHERSAKMLAITLYFMPGTVICYQGEEIGMTNVKYDSIQDFRDVEVFTEYKNFLNLGYSEDESLSVIKARCRDNARTPMQWNDKPFAGFSKYDPWMKVNSDYLQINVLKEQSDNHSIYQMYKTILNLRLTDLSIINGKIEFIDILSDESFCYINRYQNSAYLVVANFKSLKIEVDLSKIEHLESFHPFISNITSFPTLSQIITLNAYEAFVYKKES
ncbi:MAG: alpha-glucosidase [Firmicutes bacterium]|nr:alpha-glucosidase [Bacillota bacterium]